jgi:hypothetical protein
MNPRTCKHQSGKAAGAGAKVHIEEEEGVATRGAVVAMIANATPPGGAGGDGKKRKTVPSPEGGDKGGDTDGGDTGGGNRRAAEEATARGGYTSTATVTLAEKGKVGLYKLNPVYPQLGKRLVSTI